MTTMLMSERGVLNVDPLTFGQHSAQFGFGGGYVVMVEVEHGKFVQMQNTLGNFSSDFIF